MPFAATWMDLDIITLNEVSQLEKDKYHMITLLCGKILQMNLSTKQITDIENELVVIPGVTGGGGARWVVG